MLSTPNAPSACLQLLRMFDVPKKKPGEPLDEDEKALQELAEGMEAEELQATIEALQQAAVSDEGEEDELLWEHELVDDDLDVLTAQERAQLEALLKPVRLVLVKV